MTSPRVSVLIPCFNAERFVGETIESVLGQSWPAIEVIVVDDGSTDASVDVVRGFAGRNVRLIEQRHRGQTAALNTCLEYATGEFVQYLDADDLVDADKIEKQIARLVEHPGSVASAEWGRFRRDPGETAFSPEAVWRDLDPIDWLALSRADGLGMMFPALWLIPMPIVRAAGPWAEELTLNNDAEYFTRILLAASRVLFCAGARCRYRSGVCGSLSGRKSVAAWTSQFRVLDLCESHVRAREDSARVRRGFALSWQHLAHGCYPYEATLSARALARARALDSVTVRPGGGWAFRLASRVVGWRVARKLQVLSGRGSDVR
jgi:glycosyltransferase involved in cell wall biosynthesis